ncbi:alpha/beta hydrolase [bacterium]|jgi:3-oxoadipate enol-lactonase|nr:alpha/beta hydrolase [bacterium]
MDVQTIQLDGVEMYTRTYGDPSRRPVLCLHSLFLNGAMFHDWAQYVSHELFVVAPDLRGQGRSPDTENKAMLDMDLYAQDIDNFLSVLSEQYGITSVGILAQSMGGDVGLRVAYNSPDKVNSIALLGSSACNEPADQLENFQEWVRGVEEFGFRGKSLDYTLEVMLGETCRSDSQRQHVVDDMRSQLRELDKDLLPAMRGVVERESILEKLPAISIPALIFSGQEDWVRPPAWSRLMSDLLPKARLVELDNVGHSPILETPTRVYSQLEKFFLTTR